MKTKLTSPFGIMLLSVVALFVFGLAADAHLTAASLVGIDADSFSTGLQFATVGLVPMSIEELRKEADKLSSFNGGRIMRYTGEGDDLLDFNGDGSDFSAELVNNLEKQFVLSITNANAATRTAVLFAGYLKGNATLAPGQVVQGAFNDKFGAIGLSGNTESEKSIEELLLFTNWIPTRLIAIQMESNVPAQLAQQLVYQRLNPFRSEPTKSYRPNNFRNQNSFQNTLVSFPLDCQMDTLSRMELPIVGTSTVRLTFFFGTSFNPVTALQRKTARALPNVRVGGAIAENALLLNQ